MNPPKIHRLPWRERSMAVPRTRVRFELGERYYLCRRWGWNRHLVAHLDGGNVLICFSWRATPDRECFLEQEETWGWLLDLEEWPADDQEEVHQ